MQTHEEIKELADLVYKSATELPFIALKQYDLLCQYYELCNVEILLPSFVNNFKDSLMHYKKLKSAYDDCKPLDVVVQYELMVEHINRGLCDCVIGLFQEKCKSIVSEIKLFSTLLVKGDFPFEATREFYLEVQREYRKHMHNFKNYILKLRTDKMNIERLIYENDAENIGLSDAFRLIYEYFEYMDKVMGEEQKYLRHKNNSLIKRINDRALAPPD